MLEFLRKLFREETAEEVNLSGLAGWLEKETPSLGLGERLQGYFRQVQDLKSQLQEKTAILKAQEIPDKDRQQVEGRIQNIVLGHRDHYVREVERFLSELQTIEKESRSLEDFREARGFNHRLNARLEQLAGSTAKSYQAAQHLFFDQVEPVFKLLSETNYLARNFPAAQIEGLIKLKELASQLAEEKEKKEKLASLINGIEEEISELKKKKEESEREMEELRAGDSFADYNRLQEHLKKIKEQFSQVENELHSFFSRLQKPLKKYERITLDNKPVLPYLGNSLEAFWQDRPMRIKGVLQGLKKCLVNRLLEFDQKQKENFLGLIEKAEQGYLEGLRKRGEWLREEEGKVRREMGGMTIADEIKKTGEAAERLAGEIAGKEKEAGELKSRMEKVSPEEIKEEFCRGVKEVFKKEIILKT